MSAPVFNPAPNPALEGIAVYEGGGDSWPGIKKPVKLSSNETPLGASPRARAAAQRALRIPELYPDGHATALRSALARRHSIPAQQIVCGAGSGEILHLLAQAYLSPGTEAIHTAHGFLLYPIVIRAAGATPVVAPETDLTADVDAILACVNERTRAVFLANPNNPTSTCLSAAEVKRLRDGLDARILLILDAAYAEYATGADYEPGFVLVRASNNTVMTRTFSKAYGLAGLRLGWAYCPPDIAQTLNKIRLPFNVSAPASAAGIAALEDTYFVRQAVAHNTYWRERIRTRLVRAGLEIPPSEGNFLLLRFSDETEAQVAYETLGENGLIVRRMHAYGLPTALRASIGTARAGRMLLRVLRKVMREGADA